MERGVSLGLALTAAIEVSWVKSWIPFVTCWDVSIFNVDWGTLKHWLLARNRMNGYSFLWTADIIFGILEVGLKSIKFIDAGW